MGEHVSLDLNDRENFIAAMDIAAKRFEAIAESEDKITAEKMVALTLSGTDIPFDMAYKFFRQFSSETEFSEIESLIRATSLVQGMLVGFLYAKEKFSPA